MHNYPVALIQASAAGVPEQAYIREPKDARDPNGAKAPGLPGGSEGYCPGKMARNGCAHQRVEGMAERTVQVTHGCRSVQLPIQLGSLTVGRTGMCRASEIQSDTRMSMQVD